MALQAQPVAVTAVQNVVQLSASNSVEVPQDTLTMSMTTTRGQEISGEYMSSGSSWSPSLR